MRTNLAAKAGKAQTPNLDRLISQSVLFTNAHCEAPVCSASRHALVSVRLPGAINGGAVCSRSASLIDLYPTMLGLCNLPEVKGLEETSLLPQLQDPKAERRNPAITTWHYNNHAARSQNFRYIRYRDGSEELYDHRTDPNERRNLAVDPKLASIKKKLRG